MRINIKATNIELNEELKELVGEKLKHLERFEENLRKKDPLPSGQRKEDERVDVFVELGRTTKHHQKGDVFRAEMQMMIAGESLMVEALADDLREAITEARNKLEREIIEYKERRQP